MLGWMVGSVALAVNVDEVPNPRTNNGWITDLADVLPADVEDALNDDLRAIHADTDAEVAVVTVQSVPSTPRAFATELFNTWGIGDAEANNGFLILLVMDARRLEMETGYGLEAVLPDNYLGQVRERYMVPKFKQGDFGGGVVAGVAEIDKRLRMSPEEVRAGTRGAVHKPQNVDDAGLSTDDVALIGAGGATGLLVVGGGLFVRRQRIQDRTCDDCKVYMPMLSEVDDDDHLDEGQQMEEAVSSVDWQVHQCPQCDKVKTFRKNKWFSGFTQCPSCAYKTRRSTTTTLQAATEYSGGLVEVNENCAQCNYSNTYTRSTPRRASSSSSGGFSSGGGGGGGGGSFGGGSSGGGGGGSSW